MKKLFPANIFATWYIQFMEIRIDHSFQLLNFKRFTAMAYWDTDSAFGFSIVLNNTTRLSAVEFSLMADSNRYCAGKVSLRDFARSHQNFQAESQILNHSALSIFPECHSHSFFRNHLVSFPAWSFSPLPTCDHVGVHLSLVQAFPSLIIPVHPSPAALAHTLVSEFVRPRSLVLSSRRQVFLWEVRLRRLPIKARV